MASLNKKRPTATQKRRQNEEGGYNSQNSDDEGRTMFASPAAAIPPHHRKFTPHSYFSNTLREIVAAGELVSVIIPNGTAELHLRKKMFKAYQDDSIRTSKEYTQRLKEMVKAETSFIDIAFNSCVPTIRKRYVFLKSDLAGSKRQLSMSLVPLDQALTDSLSTKRHNSSVDDPQL